MLKAVLFDMDGVIVDSEPLHKKAYYKMFNDVEIDVSETLFESFTGQSTLKICKTLCHDFSLSNSPDSETVSIIFATNSSPIFLWSTSNTRTKSS